MVNHLLLNCAHYMYSNTASLCTMASFSKSLKSSSLRHIVTTNFAATVYHFALQDIVPMKSRYNDISATYCKDYTDISLIYRFNVRQSMGCFADIIIGNKSWEQSMIFVDYRLHYFCTVLYLCPPQGRLTEIPKGKGVSKAQFLEWKYDTKMEFLEEWGSST